MVCAKARHKLDSLGSDCNGHVNICAARYNKIIYKALSTGRSVSITRAGREVFHQLQFERNVNIWPDNSGLTSWKNCWFNRYALWISRLCGILSVVESSCWKRVRRVRFYIINGCIFVIKIFCEMWWYVNAIDIYCLETYKPVTFDWRHVITLHSRRFCTFYDNNDYNRFYKFLFS